jgi:DHA1 family bicyclomycin/chloramphenicol resistance-like MFS transporter
MMDLILLLALLSAFPPLSTDMYLPAIPYLQSQWHLPLLAVNMTLILFFVTYCVCLLIYGPLSDRFGRRPPLLWGIGVFIVSCFFCASANGIRMLILARIFQAAGAASASTIAMAIAKDRLDAGKRQMVLGYIAVIMALAPMVSPMIGSLIMTRLTWPWIFGVQAVMGIVAFIGVLLMKESHPSPTGSPLSDLVKSYGRVISNGRFMGVTVCSSLVGLPHFAFIAGSASIYITDFHLSESAFSLYFGANALCLMAGSMMCARFGSKIGTLNMMTLGYLGMIVGGIAMFSGFFKGPMGLALPMGFISFTGGLSRPPANTIALEQVSQDTGTASSAMVFCYFIVGAISMAGVSRGWADKVHYLSIVAMTSGILSLTLWAPVRNKLHIPR